VNRPVLEHALRILGQEGETPGNTSALLCVNIINMQKTEESTFSVREFGQLGLDLGRSLRIAGRHLEQLQNLRYRAMKRISRSSQCENPEGGKRGGCIVAKDGDDNDVYIVLVCDLGEEVTELVCNIIACKFNLDYEGFEHNDSVVQQALSLLEGVTEIGADIKVDHDAETVRLEKRP
jgi:hypothetical protein